MLNLMIYFTQRVILANIEISIQGKNEFNKTNL